MPRVMKDLLFPTDVVFHRRMLSGRIMIIAGLELMIDEFVKRGVEPPDSLVKDLKCYDIPREDVPAWVLRRMRRESDDGDSRD